MKNHFKSKKKICFFLLIITCISLFITQSFAQKVYQDSIVNGNNFEKAAFSLWTNHNIAQIRGIIVLMPGSNSDGRNMINDTSWQNLANRHQFALLGCYYKDKLHSNMGIESYADAKNGSGQAMLDIINNFSMLSKHPELSNAPLVLWGESAGGEFNYEFLCWKPERLISFVVNKGGIYYSALSPELAWEVPGLFIIGEKDSPYRNNIIKGIFSINRRFGAKWILAVDPKVGHEFKKSEKFSQSYFDKIIPLRLSLDDSNNIKKLKSDNTSYIGFSDKRKVVMESDKNISNDITSWFPNRSIADIWLKFIK